MTPAEIASHKRLLSHLKATLANTPLAEDLTVSSSESGLSATPIKDIWFAEDCAYDWQDFFKNADKKTHRGWVMLSMEDVRSLDRYAKQMFEPLGCMIMSMKIQLSWRSAKDEMGNKCTKDVIEVMCLGPEIEGLGSAFDSSAILDFIKSKICLSKDPRATQNQWLDLQANAAGDGSQTFFSSYTKHRYGITATFSDKEALEQARKTILAGCLIETDTSKGSVSARIIMPDMIAQYKDEKSKQQISALLDLDPDTLEATHGDQMPPSKMSPTP